jgi:hypothetical protein
MRKRTRSYTVQLQSGGALHKVPARHFFARLSVGAIYRPDPVRRPKLARVSPGFLAWVEDGELRLRRWYPWRLWQAFAAAKVRTNAQIIEQLAILAIWTPWATELERQREAALQYAD